MDPLSIIASSTSLAALCLKCSTLLYEYINDTKNVDATVSTFCSEIDSLAQVLDSIKTNFRHPRTVAVIQAAQDEYDGRLWSNIGKLLDRCKISMVRLEKILGGLNKSTGGGLLRKPIKQLRFSMKSDEIVMLRQQVQSHNLMMQITLQSISM